MTPAYKNAGAVRTKMMELDFEPVTDSGLSAKPCFFVAERTEGQWIVARYVGEITPEGSFKGSTEKKYAGNAHHMVRREIFKAFVDWTQAQSPANLVIGLNPLFENAQKVHANHPVNGRKPSGPS